jgi:hypothetical protein
MYSSHRHGNPAAKQAKYSAAGHDAVATGYRTVV